MNQEETGITKLGCVNHDCGHCQPKREWVGLTDEEIKQLCLSVGAEPIEVRFIEAKLKAKNFAKEKNT